MSNHGYHWQQKFVNTKSFAKPGLASLTGKIWGCIPYLFQKFHTSFAASEALSTRGANISKNNVVGTICPRLDIIGLTNLPKNGTSGTPSSTITDIYLAL